jgi:flagellar hook protein FlgE
MFFEQGLGGLSAAEQKLNIIGKNIANGNTNGYKTSSIEFTNVLADTLNTPNTGASITAASGPLSGKVTQSFTQGPISGTGNPLDIAINGKGFFQLKDPASGKLSYTRDGAFKLNGKNQIENASGLLLTGLQGGVSGPIDLTNYQTFSATNTSALDSFSIDSSGNINGLYSIKTR